jgi:mono/diheme cytochrome c family protein
MSTGSLDRVVRRPRIFARFVDSEALLGVIGKPISAIIVRGESPAAAPTTFARPFHLRGVGMLRGSDSLFARAATPLAGAVAALVVASCVGLAADEAKSAEGSSRVSFNTEIRPIFAKHCVGCHGGVKEASGLSFIYRETALAEAESGIAAILPGNAADSQLIERVTDRDPDSRMPPGDHGPALEPEQIELLRRWIDQGAEWEQHWSFTPPRDHQPPKVKQENWPRDPLDQFVLARLETAGLAPAPDAARAEWLRRVSLDLIGLPPTAEEFAEFELDNRPDAFQRVVARLLASPRYGERWASMWLDLARYADTVGFEKDPHRDIWPYRDWLIRALNDDMPFDEFTVRQLAGDLLPGATLDDRLATAFHRNTQMNTEGGTDDEEYRLAAVLDRVSTTWQVWQASTFRCTQCHSHPYDPFRHEEYYKFVAFFNTSRDADVNSDEPLLAIPDDAAKWAEAERLDRHIAEFERELFELQSPLAGDSARWQALPAIAASATGNATMAIRREPEAGVAVSEVRAEGTITAGSTFTVDLNLAGVDRLTAVRIDALPKDPAQALKIPEDGFVLSQLTGELVDAAGAAAGEVRFVAAFCDEPTPLFDPEESLREGADGWGDYTRMSRRRFAVFILDRAIEIPPGTRLRLSMRFGQADSGGGALAIERGRFAASSSDDWIPFANDSRYARLKRQLAELRNARAAIAGVAVPIMAEQPAAFARQTQVFARGNWLDRETVVTPGVPEVMPPLPAGAPADRLAMARWLASPENPLTARVMVNRLWQELFGIGIVETAEDFGTSGELPSHPELLDHLALRFQDEHGWSVKRMLRDIVLSSAYRQGGVATSEKLALDPRNRLIARGPRTRLSAEMVRDQALALSGRLSEKMYGKPVMPPQPEGVWRSVYNGESWITAEGEDRYRRAVYTYWKRTSGYPALATFDMPSRDVCVVRRIATNTPLQALATLNDEAFVELARAFAERMQVAGNSPAEQIAAGYRLATGQTLHTVKLRRLLQLYEEAAAAFDADPAAAKPLAAERDAYALTIVANAMLNLDDLMTK